MSWFWIYYSVNYSPEFMTCSVVQPGHNAE